MEDVERKNRFWCPFEYEFLSNFCYVCGKLSHVEKSSDESNWRLRDKPLGEWLRTVPTRRRIQGESRASKSGGGSALGA
jgi:hypothetical protein